MSNTVSILIDGKPDPACFEFDRQHPFINTSVRGQMRRFQFAKVIEKDGQQVFVYRDVKADVSDKEFDRLAAEEADKFLNPGKYAKMQGPQAAPLADPERAELEAFRKKYGALKG